MNFKHVQLYEWILVGSDHAVSAFLIDLGDFRCPKGGVTVILTCLDIQDSEDPSTAVIVFCVHTGIS